MKYRTPILCCLFLLLAPVARAQSTGTTGTLPLRGFFEVSGFGAELTADQPQWRELHARSVIDVGRNTTVGFEVSHQSRWNDAGVYYGGFGTVHLSDRVYATVSGGGSDGGFFLPSYRADGSISVKWLARKSLVTTFGVGVYDAKDVYRDRSASFEAIYYFGAPWILQAGVRLNVSDPGGVRSTQQFVALTQGRPKQYLVVGRVGWGREAYQLVGPEELISDFPSQVASLSWRQWVGRDWGVTVAAERYHNPYYDRTGISLGLFRDF